MFPTRRVLVVEDYDDARELIKFILISQGCEVIEAADGETAINLAREKIPDLIFMDIAMPIMDGLTATRQIHQFSETSHIPIVVLSAYCRDDTKRREAMKAGAVECIDKPAEPEKLGYILNKYFGNS